MSEENKAAAEVIEPRGKHLTDTQVKRLRIAYRLERLHAAYDKNNADTWVSAQDTIGDLAAEFEIGPVTVSNIISGRTRLRAGGPIDRVRQQRAEAFNAYKNAMGTQRAKARAQEEVVGVQPMARVIVTRVDGSEDTPLIIAPGESVRLDYDVPGQYDDNYDVSTDNAQVAIARLQSEYYELLDAEMDEERKAGKDHA
ncbi:DNA binding protein [Corynebacterium phage EmiRose]|uniref:DNA binding protein n=1 Tax=Corynebacterium phage EmiRose TaxID=2565372 RepID=A0A649VQF7_9CAUD|nr:DNA binding protein [Corynebacterium phage EmiRose]QGJ94172.1 DNA binding protein [Corynebacterium phage EmiRose]